MEMKVSAPCPDVRRTSPWSLIRESPVLYSGYFVLESSSDPPYTTAELATFVCHFAARKLRRVGIIVLVKLEIR